MDDQQREKVGELIELAIARPAAERETFLREACGVDEELKREIRSLVSALESADRVVVARFENRTGDPTRDPIGSMAADWIVQGLAETGLVNVVPITAALTASSFVSRTGGADGPEWVWLLAEETGAGIVVSGAYYEQGDSIYLHATVSDASRRRVLHAVPPIATPRSLPLAAVVLIRERLMSVLASLLNPRMLENVVTAGRQPPTFDAYRSFAEGLELLAHGSNMMGEAVLQQSLEIAPRSNDVADRFFLAHAYVLVGEWDRAESILQELIADDQQSMNMQGELGTLAARRGRAAEATRIAGWLADLDEPYLHGRNTYWRARIAALLGERNEAVTLLQQAAEEGFGAWDVLHREPDFASLREYEPFLELIRPKG